MYSVRCWWWFPSQTPCWCPFLRTYFRNCSDVACYCCCWRYSSWFVIALCPKKSQHFLPIWKCNHLVLEIITLPKRVSSHQFVLYILQTNLCFTLQRRVRKESDLIQKKTLLQSAETERKTRRDSAVSQLLLFCLVTSTAQREKPHLLPWQLIGAPQNLIIIHLCGFVYNLPPSESSVRARKRKKKKEESGRKEQAQRVEKRGKSIVRDCTYFLNGYFSFCLHECLCSPGPSLFLSIVFWKHTNFHLPTTNPYLRPA